MRPGFTIMLLLLSLQVAHGSIEKWNVPVTSYIQSSPAAYEGTTIFGSHDGRVYAIDIETGREAHASFQVPDGGAVDMHPAVADGMIYVGSDKGSVYALDASNLQLAWAANIGGVWQSRPVVSNGVVYVGSLNGTVYALDASDGSVKWTYVTGGEMDASPALYNGRLYVASNDGRLYSLYAKNGSREWSLALGGLWTSSPVISDGVLYIGSMDGSVYSISVAGPQINWKRNVGSGVMATPLVLRDRVIVGSNDHKVRAFNAVSGNVLWSFETGGSVQGDAAYAPDEIGGYTIYVGSNDNKVYALDWRDGSEKWSYDTGGWVSARPLVHGSLLVVASHSGRAHGLSTVSCSFTEPEERAGVSGTRVTVYGNAWSDSGVERVEVRVNGGEWKEARGTTGWRIDLTSEDLRTRELLLECRTIAAEGAERAPYNALSLIYQGSSMLDRPMKVEYPRGEVAYGSDVLLKITDENGNPLAGVAASWPGGTSLSNQRGEVVVKVLVEGESEVELRSSGYETKVVKLRAGTNWYLYGGIGVAVLAIGYFLFLRRH